MLTNTCAVRRFQVTLQLAENKMKIVRRRFSAQTSHHFFPFFFPHSYNQTQNRLALKQRNKMHLSFPREGMIGLHVATNMAHYKLAPIGRGVGELGGKKKQKESCLIEMG